MVLFIIIIIIIIKIIIIIIIINFINVSMPHSLGKYHTNFGTQLTYIKKYI